MGTVLDLFHQAFSDPETVKTLSEAYEKACKSLHDTGQPQIVNEIIAQRIIALALKGERDPDRLCAGALIALGNKAVFER
jgi:hypothetical protein